MDCLRRSFRHSTVTLWSERRSLSRRSSSLDVSSDVNSDGRLADSLLLYSGSIIGGTDEIKEMLKLASEKNIKAWVEVRPMADAAAAVRDMEDGKARYRYVLKN